MIEKDWKHELNMKESLICFKLSLKLNSGNDIYLSEKEMYEYCGYKSSRYFKKHLDTLIEKLIILNLEVEGETRYFFNPLYVEYDDLGPKIYHRPLMEKTKMLKVLKDVADQLTVEKREKD